MTETKILVFDMDGTLADFYGVSNWLEYLQENNPTPYIVAKPLIDIAKLNSYLLFLKTCGWEIVITSWLAKNSNKKFDDEVRQAKKEWLKKYNFPFDELHLIKYGTTKANCTRKKGGYQILVDDNAKVRKGWTLGHTIDATGDLLNEILSIIKKEIMAV
jgi:hypothetical protein